MPKRNEENEHAHIPLSHAPYAEHDILTFDIHFEPSFINQTCDFMCVMQKHIHKIKMYYYRNLFVMSN